MRQLIDAMQSNFNIVCDQLREAQTFYDHAEKCIQEKDEQQDQLRVEQMSRPIDQFSSDEEGVMDQKT